MDDHQIRLVQSTFERAVRMRAYLAATFYFELFALEPGLKSMFRGDMVAQGQKLVDTLELAVNGLRRLPDLAPALETLAVRHLAYGVTERHYACVRVALMRTLSHELGDDFTPEARAAWSETYDAVAGVMIRAAYGEPAPAPR